MSKENGYPGASAAINELLSMLAALDPDKALEYAGMLEHRAVHDCAELGAHIRRLHARMAVEDALWRHRGGDKPA